MSNIDFYFNVSDLSDYGIGVVTNEDGSFSVFDDRSNSYESWNITYDEIQDRLYAVWKDRVKQKRYTKEAYDFERNLGYFLDRLAEGIVNRSWKPAGYFDFKVFHPERVISAPFYKDRIVEHWLTDEFVKPCFEPLLRDENVACRIDKGPPAGHKVIIETLKKMYEKYKTDFYVFQYDIQGYFDNVNHDRIREMFSVLPALGYKLFMNIVDDWRQEDCYAFQNNPSGVYGSPKGNLPSQWIGLVYLNEIDWYIASRPDCEDSTRYMDDGICFFHLKSSCKDCKIKIEKMLKDKDMGVRLHPKKTRYAPVSQGFTFCGWRYTMSNDGRIKTRLKTERKAVTKRRMKKMTYDYYRGTIGLDKVRQRVNGMDAFFRQGDTKQFKRYLSYRFMFTRDEDKYFKDYSYRFRKNKSRKKEDKVNEKEKKVGFDG